ncbi:hypothetical protein [Hymenobacter jejuensis]|uniref:Uncharacterized protein n=1 Tax=Hymenobacter jejuensis TaxID=2502781 RepID=A0A5B8A062_9BACT|nr:hypothetical protein [Hymenobacter jejuensis]QDA60123.1 hypothetical protein FHG12_08380 [Hymenobacter jejuensis]
MLDSIDDIDFVLRLHSEGWSTCIIYIENKSYELIITHVFGDPYYNFMHSLMGLINGLQSANFFWYNEPGGARIEITKLKAGKDIVLVNIQSFKEAFGNEIKVYEENICFEIKLKSLLILSYMQLKKIFLLLKERDFAQHRSDGFPFRKFVEFEKAVKDFVRI